MAVSYPQMRRPPLLITVIGLGFLVVAGVFWWRGDSEEAPVVQEEEKDETGMTSEEREELMRIIGYVQQ